MPENQSKNELVNADSKAASSRSNPQMKISVLAEAFIGKGNGVYTAFQEAVRALKNHPEMTLHINTGFGDSDIIYAHSIGLIYARLALRYSQKLIVTAHVVPESFIGSLILSRYWAPVARWYLRWCFNQAKLVLAVSPIVKRELQKIGVCTPIEVLGNPVNLSQFKWDETQRQNLRKKYGIAVTDFVVLCVGQIQPRKGVLDFVAVAKKLPHLQFVWVGGRPFGRLTEEYGAHSKVLQNPPPNVHFVGMVELDQMPGHYAMADVLFFPSFQETFGFPMIEGGAVGLPLVLRDNPEYIDLFEEGYLKAKTITEFADILDQLSKDSTMQKEWTEKAKQIARRYDSRIYTEKLLHFCRRIKG